MTKLFEQYLYDEADKLLETGKGIFRSNGELQTAFFIVKDKKPGLVGFEHGFDGLDKKEVGEVIATLAANVKAEYIIHVSEAWVVERPSASIKPGDDLPVPSQSSDRKEKIVVYIMNPKGEISMKMSDINRIDETKVEFEDSEWCDGGEMYTVPPWEDFEPPGDLVFEEVKPPTIH